MRSGMVFLQRDRVGSEAVFIDETYCRIFLGPLNVHICLILSVHRAFLKMALVCWWIVKITRMIQIKAVE